MPYKKFKPCTDKISNYKDKIKKTFFTTQNLIFTSFFNRETKNLLSITRIEEYRKYLYSFKNLIGLTDNYSYFNEFYIQKMNELDNRYEPIVNNKSLPIVPRSKISIFFNSIKNLFTGNANEYERQNNR